MSETTGMTRLAALRTELVEEGGVSLVLAIVVVVGSLLTWFSGESGISSSSGLDFTAGTWTLVLAIVAAVIALVTLVNPINSKLALMLFADITILAGVMAVLSITKFYDANDSVYFNPGIGVIIASLASVGLVAAGLAGIYATRVFDDEWGDVL